MTLFPKVEANPRFNHEITPHNNNFLVLNNNNDNMHNHNNHYPNTLSFVQAMKKPFSGDVDSIESSSMQVRCICGDNDNIFDDDNNPLALVRCISCDNWQHSECMTIPDYDPSQRQHYCDICKPNLSVHVMNRALIHCGLYSSNAKSRKIFVQMRAEANEQASNAQMN
jgi:hypothetical protein